MWLVAGLGIVLLVVLASIVLFVVAKMLQRREPYGSFLRLEFRGKLRFLRSLAADARTPRRVKVLPFLLAAYLAFPIDLIPDFIPVLGYLDDVAIVLAVLALVLRLTPREVVDELIAQAADPPDLPR